MEKRKLGRSDIAVYPLMIGGNVFGWTIKEDQSFRVLDEFAASGFNFIDTADVYSTWAAGNSGGESESIIGNWMKQRKNRNKLIVATKVGSDMGNGKKGLRKKYILQAAEASLKRLQTDHIDLYQTHYDDPETPVEETLDAYGQLIRDGKVRVIGASNMTPERLLASLKASKAENLPRYEALQPEYNLYAREKFEKDFAPICAEHGLGVINYYALASGFLTGKYRSEADFGKSARGHGMKKYFNSRGTQILAALDDVGKSLGATPAQVAIAWLLAQPLITAPIASVTSPEQWKDISRAVQISLDAQHLKMLDEASAH